MTTIDSMRKEMKENGTYETEEIFQKEIQELIDNDMITILPNGEIAMTLKGFAQQRIEQETEKMQNESK